MDHNFHFENPHGLIGLMLISIFSLFVSKWLSRKKKAALRKKGGRVHPGVALASVYFELKSFFFSAAMVIGLIFLAIKSKR